MMSLFSSFDLKYCSTLALSIGISCLILFPNFYKINFLNKSSMPLTFNLGIFFYSLNKKNLSKMFLLFCVAVMSYIFCLNFFSLTPYGSALTGQLSVVLWLSIMSWSSMLIFSIFKSTKGLITHFVPSGTPSFLILFIFLIEIVSISMRPITLTVRLVANIVAGHLLMNLLFSLTLNFHYSFFLYVILNLVEMAVSLIQSYIFVTLLSIYYSEV